MKMARTKNSNSTIDTRLGGISLRTNTGKVRVRTKANARAYSKTRVCVEAADPKFT